MVELCKLPSPRSSTAKHRKPLAKRLPGSGLAALAAMSRAFRQPTWSGFFNGQEGGAVVQVHLRTLQVKIFAGIRRRHYLSTTDFAPDGKEN